MRDKPLFHRAVLFTAGWLVLSTAGIAHAQLPSIRVSGPEAAIFEGNPGTPPVTLDFTVQLSSVSAQEVTVLFSTFTFANNAVSGASCATANQPGGTDFIGIINRIVTIPANANPPAVTVSVTTCRDTQVEPPGSFVGGREEMGVILTVPVNAVCNGSECLNVGNIVDDDGAPFASIGNATVREPLTGSRMATFTVSLAHPHPGFEVRVGFSARNGTARAVSGSCGSGLTDFLARSGTLIFPPNVVTATVEVPVCADATDGESTETFFVDLTGQLNAFVSSFPGRGSILEAFTFTPGIFSLDSQGIDGVTDEWIPYRFGSTLSILATALARLDLSGTRAGGSGKGPQSSRASIDEIEGRAYLARSPGPDGLTEAAR
jgi:hypothetical protein